MKLLIKLVLAILLSAIPSAAAGASPSPTPSTAPTAQPIPKPVAGELWINEFLPNPGGTDTGNEWIELKNASSKTLDIGDVKVKRVSGTTLATVPAGTMLPSGDVYLLNVSGSMINSGDTLELWVDTLKLDQVTYDNAEDDLAWARLGATDGAWTDAPTPGQQNPADVSSGGGDAASGGEAASASTRAPALGSTAASRRAQTAAARRGPVPKGGIDTLAYGLPVLLATLYAYVRRPNEI